MSNIMIVVVALFVAVLLTNLYDYLAGTRGWRIFVWMDKIGTFIATGTLVFVFLAVLIFGFSVIQTLLGVPTLMPIRDTLVEPLPIVSQVIGWIILIAGMWLIDVAFKKIRGRRAKTPKEDVE